MEVNKNINNFFEQELVDNGYKIFNDTFKGAIRGFQKKITDKEGIRYFITIYHYNFGLQFPDRGIEPRDSYSFHVQFRANKDSQDQCIDVHYSSDMIENQYRPITTLRETEDFFDKFFTTFNVDYYEKYEY